jgi:hypothetical protein
MFLFQQQLLIAEVNSFSAMPLKMLCAQSECLKELMNIWKHGSYAVLVFLFKTRVEDNPALRRNGFPAAANHGLLTDF